MELKLDPNDQDVKLSWSDDGAWSKPICVPTERFRKYIEPIRRVLKELNEYVKTTQLNIQRDPGWETYDAILATLRKVGDALCQAIFHFADAPATDLLNQLRLLPPSSELKIHCSDSQVALPFGFLYMSDDDGQCDRVVGSPPSRSDFSSFWLCRFDITVLVLGSGCSRKSLTVEPSTFKSLYALHKQDLADAYDYLGDDKPKLERLQTSIEIKKCYYDWDSAQEAFASIRESDAVIFVFAHSNGDELMLERDRVDAQKFARMLQVGRRSDHVALVMLNCCLSVAGKEHCSFLSAVAAKGICGLIGTEAEILNTHAVRCGTRLMWGLCAQGLTLGEAFERMRDAKDLFPLNLFYTCYANRGFKLARPLDALVEG